MSERERGGRKEESRGKGAGREREARRPRADSRGLMTSHNGRPPRLVEPVCSARVAPHAGACEDLKGRSTSSLRPRTSGAVAPSAPCAEVGVVGVGGDGPRRPAGAWRRRGPRPRAPPLLPGSSPDCAPALLPVPRVHPPESGSTLSRCIPADSLPSPERGEPAAGFLKLSFLFRDSAAHARCPPRGREVAGAPPLPPPPRAGHLPRDSAGNFELLGAAWNLLASFMARTALPCGLLPRMHATLGDT